MAPEGTYVLTHVGFSREEKPILSLRRQETDVSFNPIGNTFTLSFDTSQRACIGWHDITAGQSFACPDSVATNAQYEQCASCQKRTGFNPAFYNATTVSPQQEQRNLEPHILYLAHFAPGVVKVGISHAARDRGRLLEQGARSALILDVFPTAHIARQYEAKIAAIPGIAETIQVKRKLELLKQPYTNHDAQRELIETRTRIETLLKTSFSPNTPMTLEEQYFPAAAPSLSEAIDITDKQVISGQGIGMLGSLLFCAQEDLPTFVALKKFIGYAVTVSHTQTSIDLPVRQMTLF
ncbi:DUF2797 domain-containing protein [Streptomyces caniscabiei]|uniref:DUF2797 domain-containing protein n=1 Tax=Streptomyces caniscabiei TaxID=2746961 RepID=UPI0029AC99B2|nr:DUF2797 domain-containing protein [Streptomyces caniscabiei]MDX2776017.1 DUF2797 domain-containing protein [Streptomyces caniscabiei]